MEAKVPLPKAVAKSAEVASLLRSVDAIHSLIVALCNVPPEYQGVSVSVRLFLGEDEPQEVINTVHTMNHRVFAIYMGIRYQIPHRNILAVAVY